LQGDWSSDVCSSDLGRHGALGRRGSRVAVPWCLAGGKGRQSRGAREVSLVSLDRRYGMRMASMLLMTLAAAAPLYGQKAGKDQEIGRASCRESVEDS